MKKHTCCEKLHVPQEIMISEICGFKKFYLLAFRMVRITEKLSLSTKISSKKEWAP